MIPRQKTRKEGTRKISNGKKKNKKYYSQRQKRLETRKSRVHRRNVNEKVTEQEK
jgi:hypothetical protein